MLKVKMMSKKTLKMPCLFIGLMCFYTLILSAADSINWQDYQAGIIRNKTAEKIMIVDVFTVWCGWCKRMDATTYSDESVIRLINKYFIPVKLNGESNQLIQLQGKEYEVPVLLSGLGIRGFPSTVFIDDKQKVLSVVPGYIQTEDMKKILVFLGEKYYLKKNYQDFLESYKQPN